MADQTKETVNQQKQETITKQKNHLRVELGKRLVESWIIYEWMRNEVT